MQPWNETATATATATHLRVTYKTFSMHNAATLSNVHAVAKGSSSSLFLTLMWGF